MAVELCGRCGNYVDLDYNTNGEYLPDDSSHDNYHCEDCVIELEEE